MNTKTISNFNEFYLALLECGFSMGGTNSDGIYSISSLFSDNIVWHTDNIDTDPWEWRMRVLEEHNDISYSKLFFNKSGYITKGWYPYFIACRRQNKSFDQDYSDGNISYYAKRIYDVIHEEETIPLHVIKQTLDIKKEDKSKFDKAIVELQMKLYITMCGRQQKTNRKGESYGWSSTVFCTTEKFFGDDVFKIAKAYSTNEAEHKITEQILKLNPKATEKKIKKFIYGK